jgi:hypothetical protein
MQASAFYYYTIKRCIPILENGASGSIVADEDSQQPEDNTSDRILDVISGNPGGR